MTHINVERLLRETPLSVEPSSIDAVHQRLFGPARRRAPEHYAIHEELGRGAFGRVYRAIDQRYPREVALKVIPYHGPRQLARLEREAWALAGLAHPNIVPIFDKGIADAGVYFLATERVTGTQLDEWMHDPARRLPELLEVFAQAAEGLHHAHQRGMVHRDFKPSNAIVDRDGRLRILDFGLVELVGAPESPLASSEAGETVPEGVIPLATAASQVPLEPTRSSEWSLGDGAPAGSGRVQSFRGTAAYAAPEQLDGVGVDSRSDQFSLCVALFEACHGFRPFSGRTVLELSEQIAAGAIVRGRSRHSVPRWLDRLLRRGLAHNPLDRHAHTGEIAAILRAHLRPKPWGAMAAAVVLTLGLVAGVHAATRPPTIDFDWTGAWPEDTGPEWAEKKFGPGLRQGLVAYEQAWTNTSNEYENDPERQAEGPVNECFDATKQRFYDFVVQLKELDELKEPKELEPRPRLTPSSASSERLWLAHLATPRECLTGGPTHPPNDALVTALDAAQAARLAGRYDEALERLVALGNEPELQRGRAAGLYEYELGLVQLHRWDPEAWNTLTLASYDAGDDLELRVEVLAQRLEAGVVLETVEPDQLVETLRLLEEWAPQAGPRQAVRPIEALAQAFVMFRRGSHDEARRGFAEARQAFAALEPSPYRDLMIAQCTLNEAYVEDAAGLPPSDLEAGVAALARMGQLLGEGHPKVLRHSIRVARLLEEANQLDRAQAVLAAAVAESTAQGHATASSTGVAFDLVRAQAELVVLDLVRHDYGLRLDPTARSRKAMEWATRAFELGARLDAIDADLGEAQRVDVDRVREILLSVHSVADDHVAMTRLLDRMWSDAVRLDKAEALCESASVCADRADDEKKPAPEEILEIEERIRTRCGCGIDQRPEHGRSTANDANERTSRP